MGRIYKPISGYSGSNRSPSNHHIASPRSPSHPIAVPHRTTSNPIAPRSSSFQIATPRSVKHQLQGTNSPRYLSPVSPRQPWPSHQSPPPEPPVFLDAKDKNLPYDGEFMLAPSSVFDHPDPCGIKEEGELLIAVLTGVQGSPLRKVFQGMPGWDMLHGVPEHSGNGIQSVTRGANVNNILNIDRRKRQKRRTTLRRSSAVDAAVDTRDLEELNAEEDDENWSFDEAEEEVRYRDRILDIEERAGSGHLLTLDDYIKMVKKSTCRIGQRTQMLHELSLGEDINMGVADSELPVVPPPEKPGTDVKAADSGQPVAKVAPVYKSAMRATSLVLKKLRRLAGQMHTEQQSIDLKDIYDWLLHLGTVATDPGKPGDSGTSGIKSPGRGSTATDENTRVDWRLPSSPAAALLMAQEDLRQRLAYLYEEQSLIEDRKRQLEAAKRLVGMESRTEQAGKLSAYLHGLQSLGEGYEELGGRIVQNLDEVETLDIRLKQLNEKGRDHPQDVGKLKRRTSMPKKGTSTTPKKGGSGDKGMSKKGGSGQKSLSNKKKLVEDGEGESQGGIDSEDEEATSSAPGSEVWLKEGSAVMRGNEISYGASSGDDSESGGKKMRFSSEKSSVDVDPEGNPIGADRKRTTDSHRKGEGAAELSENSSDNTTEISPARRRTVSRSEETVGVGRSSMQGGRSAVSAQPGSRGSESEPETHDKGRQSKVTAAYHAERVQGRSRQQHIARQTQEVQTDDAALFSLMENLMQAMSDDGPEGTEDPATKLRRLLRENKKMKVQLRFWRSRNWLENTTSKRYPRSGLATGSQAPLPVDSPSEAGFAFYFNSIRSPSVLSADSTVPGDDHEDDSSGTSLQPPFEAIPDHMQHSEATKSQPKSFRTAQRRSSERTAALDTLRVTDGEFPSTELLDPEAPTPPLGLMNTKLLSRSPLRAMETPPEGLNAMFEYDPVRPMQPTISLLPPMQPPLSETRNRSFWTNAPGAMQLPPTEPSTAIFANTRVMQPRRSEPLDSASSSSNRTQPPRLEPLNTALFPSSRPKQQHGFSSSSPRMKQEPQTQPLSAAFLPGPPRPKQQPRTELSNTAVQPTSPRAESSGAPLIWNAQPAGPAHLRVPAAGGPLNSSPNHMSRLSPRTTSASEHTNSRTSPRLSRPAASRVQVSSDSQEDEAASSIGLVIVGRSSRRGYLE